MEYFHAPEPRYVDPKLFFAAMRPLLFLALWGRKRRVLRDGRAYRDYFTMRMQFDTTNAERLLGPAGISPPPVLDYLDRLFHYCVASDWGRKPVASLMNIFRRYQFARDRSVTVANLVDELLLRKGDCEVSVEDKGPFHLAELHADICPIDAFLRRPIALQPGQPVAIYRTNDPACFHWFLAIIRAGGIAVPLNPLLSLAEVRRILAESGTEILVTDQAVFERSIGQRSALDVRTWIQADDETETLDGFVRVSRDAEAQRFRRPPSIPPPPSRSSIPPAPAAFPKGRRCRAMRCSERARPRCWRGCCWGRAIWR